MLKYSCKKQRIDQQGLQAREEEQKMTSRMVKRAFDEVSKLPEGEQDAVAAWLLKELASERKWDEAFRKSGKAMASLAVEALREHRRGQTEGLEPEKL